MKTLNLHFPFDIDDTIYRVNMKSKQIEKYYVIGINKYKKGDRGWLVTVKDSKNKYKYSTYEFPLEQYEQTLFNNPYKAKSALEKYLIPKDYEIVCKCGHCETVSLFGTSKMKGIRLEQLKGELCSQCKHNQYLAEGKKAVRMHYSEYKKKYSHCPTRNGSYEQNNDTIEVYVDN